MASIIPALTNYLLSVSDITNIVGTSIKSGSIAQGSEPPYIIIKRINADHEQDLAGTSDFVKTSLELSCVSYTYAEADNLFEQLRLNLDGYQQLTMGTIAPNTFWINSTRLTNDWDIEDEPKVSGGKWTYSRIAIYDISYPQANTVV